MIRGKLGIEAVQYSALVFDGLLGTCTAPRREARAVRSRRWEDALGYWELRQDVADVVNMWASRHNVLVSIITWHPPGFDDALAGWLEDRHVYVRGVESWESYTVCSMTLATDPAVQEVFDPDPAHRHGYGFKGRSFEDVYFQSNGVRRG